MNELSELNNNNNSYSSLELSPFDPSYPITLLSESLENSLYDAENAVQSFCSAIVDNVPIASELSKLEKGSRYVVVMSDKLKEEIESGRIKLTTNKEGELFAQILGPDNKFGKKLPIVKEDFTAGINITELAILMKLKSMQKQLKRMETQIRQIDSNIKDVLRGQQNDRIAHYYSGVSLYMEAQAIENAELRRVLISQALKTLSDSTFQLRLDLQSKIRYLQNEEYRNEKGKRTYLIDSKMNDIHQDFAYIHQTALLKAGIYCREKEFGAMSTTLDEYSYFIENNIAKNANFLAQCDFADNGANYGVWETRANMKIDTKEITRQLASKENTIYLDIQEDKNER